MLSSSARLSFPILCQLWHLGNVDGVELVTQVFAGIGLGKVAEDGQEKVFCLHDLQFRYCSITRKCALVATSRPGEAGLGTLSGHSFFLSACESLTGPVSVRENIGAEWVQLCFEDGPQPLEQLLRNFVGQNYFRYLPAAVSVIDDDCIRPLLFHILADFR